MSPENPPLPAGLRVLVADDNRDAADSLATLLRLWGCDVRVCYSGQECLEAAPAFQPHVAILDLAMPGASGFDVAQHLRQRPDAVRLVALTGLSTEEHRGLAQQVGFDEYLLKPADPIVLRGLLAALAPKPSD